MEYRLNKQTLTELLGQWNAFLKRKVHLVACGGTALTLMDIKPSTKDVDFMVPVGTKVGTCLCLICLWGNVFTRQT